ncbi:MAG: sortase [Candidatus Dormiibacterota bacterium]
MKTALVRCVAVAMILAGLVVGGRVVYGFMHTQSQDSAQDKAWQTFVSAAAGQDNASASAPSPAAGTGAGTGGGPSNLYLKLTIPKINTSAVSVDGDWNSLKQTSMVHYHDSPAPGTKGNALVAFHREPHWLDINKVGPGDQVQVQMADGKTYTYQVDFVKVVKPAETDLYRPTTGLDLTLITCDPPWHDNDRMIIRSHLVTVSPSA